VATRGGHIGVMTAYLLYHNERFLIDANTSGIGYRALGIFLPRAHVTSLAN
jgi:hypothetical protein